MRRSPIIPLFFFLCVSVIADGTKEESIKLTEEGKKLLAENKVDDALKKFTEAIEADITNVDAHRYYQDIQRERGRQKELLKLYGEFVRKKPSSALFNYLYGRLQTDIKEERKYYERAVELNPDFYWGHFALGYVHLTEKDLDSAKEEYEKCIELDPKRPEGYYRLACVQRELSQYEDALKTYKKIVELLPDDPTPYVEIGRTQAERGRHKEAVEAFEKALSITGEKLQRDVGFLMDYAKALSAVGRKKDAVNTYKKTLYLPLKGEVYSQLADVCRNLFIKPLPQHLQEDFIKAVKELQEKDVNSAIERFRVLQREAPDNVIILHALAEAHRRKNDIENAIKYLKEALDKNENFADAHSLLGNLYIVGKGDLKSAEQHLSLSVKLNPFDLTATTQYIRVLFMERKYLMAWHMTFFYWRLSDDLKGAQELAMSAELSTDDLGKPTEEFEHKGLTVKIYKGWKQILPGYRFIWHIRAQDKDGGLKRRFFVIMLDEQSEEGVKRSFRISELSLKEDTPPLSEHKKYDEEPSLDKVIEDIKSILDKD